MKAISIQQPWAWIIVHWQGTPSIPKKRIENRPTLKHIRGTYLIHAGKSFDRDGYVNLVARILADNDIPHEEKMEFIDTLPSMARFQRGGIVGQMNITGSTPAPDNFWAVQGQNHLHMASVKALSFMQYPGRQGVFNVDYK